MAGQELVEMLIQECELEIELMEACGRNWRFMLLLDRSERSEVIIRCVGEDYLPFPWRPVISRTWQQKYYYNRLTGLSQWHRPT